MTSDQGHIDRPTDATISEEARARDLDGVVIQVTQAFCEQGHDLVRNQEALFDGAPGISLWVSDGKKEGEVVLSPYHGDHRRFGLTDFEQGARLTLACPECKEKLKRLGKCSCPQEGTLFKVYLTADRRDANVVALCDVWGCHRSQVYDQAELLATYEQD